MNTTMSSFRFVQVYETIEAMFVRPNDVMKAMKPPEDTNSSAEEPKSRFKKLSQVFGRKNRSRKSSSEESNSAEDIPTGRQSFSNFFDNKSSLFSKKPPKPENTQPSSNKESVGTDENGWTVV